jgi:hypothetical protein
VNLVVTTVLLATLGLTGPGDPQTVFRFQDSRIVESSSLVDLGHGLTATANDSGDDGSVYVVDRSGRTVGTTRFGESEDAEAMAPARKPGYVWVGDIGDNLAQRGDVAIRRVPVGRGDRTVDVTTYRLVFPDGAHDAETLLVSPRTRRVYIVTKAPLNAGVYVAPRRLRADRPNRLTRVTTIDLIATDGAVLWDGRHALVRGYFSATLYTFPGFRRLGSFKLPAQRQGESLSVGPAGRIRIGTEGDHARVLQITLPPDLAPVLGPSPPPSGADDTSAPSRQDGPVDDSEQAPFWAVLGAIAVGLAAMAGIAHRRRAPRRTG